MCSASANALARDPGIRVGFADSDKAFVGVNDNDEIVLRGAAGI
jgi:hypothetical protein